MPATSAAVQSSTLPALTKPSSTPKAYEFGLEKFKEKRKIPPISSKVSGEYSIVIEVVFCDLGVYFGSLNEVLFILINS